ncbi:MAG: hypothetical protein LBD07_04420 [Spirochaetaceae bacterium]|jgi:hypothetical protein|nr:hypothetical protein [Spirochaetaceae bacterium]
MKIKTDTLLRTEGMEALAAKLGLVDAERFIMLIQKEPFDYTEWQEHLFENLSVEELSGKAAEYRSNTPARAAAKNCGGEEAQGNYGE